MRSRILSFTFLIGLLAAFSLTAACSAINPPPPTPLPFARFTAEGVLAAFEQADIIIQNPTREMLIGRDAPAEFADRILFEIPRIAPAGGQILVFSTPEDLAAWQTYIEGQRADPATRRNVIFVYTNANVIVQLNANLTPQEADAFYLALQRM